MRDGSALEEEPCWKPLLGGGVPRQLSYPERDLLPSLSVKPQREFPGDSADGSRHKPGLIFSAYHLHLCGPPQS